MPRSLFSWLIMLPLASMAFSEQTSAQSADLSGTWTGPAAQNVGSSGYTVVLTITRTDAVSNYPELKCGGKLTRVGEANGYVFFTETITRGGKSSGGSCIDGTVTIAPAGRKLAWGWVGSYKGQVYVAWSNLVRK